MDSNHKGYRETSPLLNPRHTGIYSRSLSQEEAILGVSNNYSRFHQRYRLYGLRWYVLLVLFDLNVSNAMVSKDKVGIHLFIRERELISNRFIIDKLPLYNDYEAGSLRRSSNTLDIDQNVALILSTKDPVF